MAEQVQPKRRPAGSQTDSVVAGSRDRRRRRGRDGARTLAGERNPSNLFCVSRRGSSPAGDVPVPRRRQLDELAGIRGHRVVRPRDVARVGSDAGDPASMVGIRAIGDDRRDDCRVVAWRRDLSR